MKVLFLDVDGVLNCRDTTQRFKGSTGIDNRHLMILSKITDEIEDLEIVVSSTWRCHPDFLDHLKDSLSFIGAEVFDVTPDMWKQNRSEGRGFEVQVWLDAHPEVTRFACIDDDGDFLPTQKLFRTMWSSGLTEEIAEQIISFFKEEDVAVPSST